MADLEAWHKGAELLAKAEEQLRIHLGPLDERVVAAAQELAAAEPQLFPDWFWWNITELRALAPVAKTDQATATEFAQQLSRLIQQLDSELEGRQDPEAVVCPRCQVCMLDGKVRVRGSLPTRLLGKALLSVRFQPDSAKLEERTVATADSIRGYVCPGCRAVFVEEGFEP